RPTQPATVPNRRLVSRPAYPPEPGASGTLGLGAPSLPEAEQAHRVLLEDQRLDVVLEAGFLEVLQPAVGRDQREVAAEEDAVLEQRVRVLDELRREVLRAPAREVDPDVGLVHGERDRLVLPRP